MPRTDIVRLGPGSMVLNQDTANPMAGVVVEPPPGETDQPLSLWVHWADGQVSLEAASDVTMTAHFVAV